jgi:hypothetical protein
MGDATRVLALVTFAGINFDKEELLQSKIIKRTFKYESIVNAYKIE